MKIGFDNEKYLKIQSEHIKERISQFDGKLYLELGGKLLMTITPAALCQVSSLIVSCACFRRLAIASRLLS